MSLQKHFPFKALDHFRVDGNRFLLAIRTSQRHSLVDQRQRYLLLQRYFLFLLVALEDLIADFNGLLHPAQRSQRHTFIDESFGHLLP